MEHLQVLNFDPARYVLCIWFVGYANMFSRVVAHPRVLAWHDYDCEPQDVYSDDEIDNDEAMSAYYMT
jgi:hypothetical protein